MVFVDAVERNSTSAFRSLRSRDTSSSLRSLEPHFADGVTELQPVVHSSPVNPDFSKEILRGIACLSSGETLDRFNCVTAACRFGVEVDKFRFRGLSLCPGGGGSQRSWRLISGWSTTSSKLRQRCHSQLFGPRLFHAKREGKKIISVAAIYTTATVFMQYKHRISSMHCCIEWCSNQSIRARVASN